MGEYKEKRRKRIHKRIIIIKKNVWAWNLKIWNC